jgi:hypothetical protein
MYCECWLGLQGLERRKEPGLKALRTARGLQEGMVSYSFFHQKRLFESNN